jgi:hypothetical protein
MKVLRQSSLNDLRPPLIRRPLALTTGWRREQMTLVLAIVVLGMIVRAFAIYANEALEAMSVRKWKWKLMMRNHAR